MKKQKKKPTFSSCRADVEQMLLELADLGDTLALEGDHYLGWKIRAHIKNLFTIKARIEEVTLHGKKPACTP